MRLKHKKTNTYEIKDALGRSWGKFRAEWVKNDTVSGRIDTTPDYEQIRHIFDQHFETFMSLDKDTDATIAAILELGAYLVDEFGNKINIEGIIFIDREGLVTCSMANSQEN